MGDKVKKKPQFFTLKRWNSQRKIDEPASPRTPTTDGPGPLYLTKLNGSGSTRSLNSAMEPKLGRKPSAGSVRELVQCSLCLEVLHNPKMLPCQHTFCMACLSVYIADLFIINCPLCNTKIQVTGPKFLDDLPSNLYIDSLLTLFGVKSESKNKAVTPPTTPVLPSQLMTAQSVDLFAAGVRCTHCQSMCDNADITACQHCKLNFCRVCWSQHLDDMKIQIGSILKQLDSAAGRLGHKIEHFTDRCEQITQQIHVAADEKINAIIETKEKILRETSDLQKSGDMTALALKSSLEEARAVALQAMTDEGPSRKNQVEVFMNLHQNALQLLSDVSKWDAKNIVFDKDNFRVEHDSSTPVDAESDDPVTDGTRHNDPLESEDSLVLHYKSRSFIPHYVWRKTARPCGVGIGPWDNNLYICGTDSHSVLIVERTHAKIVARLTCEEMLCPVHIAFMKSTEEIYVTDKWKHCVHVFSKDGEYKRSIGQKGSRHGMFRSPEGIATDNSQQHIYVVDTGNDRVQVLQPDGKFVDQLGVVKKQQVSHTSTVWETTEVLCTELNAPTSVAVTNDRVIILDSGNRRVKVYNKLDKNKIIEFGALGQRKGQFRQPEVLAVDPMGLILVGDSGNSRVQVFKQNGQLVRVFGGFGVDAGKFGWISGIHITKQLDIIISDTKNHIVNFF